MNFKKLLPFEQYTLATSLSPEEVHKRLLENVESRRMFRMYGSKNITTKEFEGEVYGSSFNISRVITYRNSFLPVIKGNITAVAGQTRINISMQPSIFVLIFISVWLCITGLVCLVMVLFTLLHFKDVMQSKISSTGFIPFGMFIFGCLLTYFGFKTESKDAKDYLAIIFSGKEIDFRKL